MRNMVTKASRLASRYIPKDSVKIEGEGGVVYKYDHVGEKSILGAVAYCGTAGHPTWHTIFRTAERRDQVITDWFTGLREHSEYKTKRAEERKIEKRAERDRVNRGEVSGDLSLTETAAFIRRLLGEIFPNTKFSVRSDSYSGGCSISVAWVDGPTSSQVRPILDRFQGADFDGMQDLKTYRDASEWNGKRVHFHVDFVHGQRRESAALLFEAADRVSYETGLPMPEIEGGHYANVKGTEQRIPFRYFWPDEHHRQGIIAHDDHEGEWYAQLIYQVARAISKEAPAKQANLPECVNDEYISATVRRMLEVV